MLNLDWNDIFKSIENVEVGCTAYYAHKSCSNYVHIEDKLQYCTGIFKVLLSSGIFEISLYLVFKAEGIKYYDCICMTTMLNKWWKLKFYFIMFFGNP